MLSFASLNIALYTIAKVNITLLLLGTALLDAAVFNVTLLDTSLFDIAVLNAILFDTVLAFWCDTMLFITSLLNTCRKDILQPQVYATIARDAAPYECTA